jgi:predicted RNA-binding Zn-ribbon protein involved in translation (DUF1610 family)
MNNENERLMEFACPSCGGHVQAESGHAGATVECPHCGKPMMLPDARETETPPESQSRSAGSGTAGTAPKKSKIRGLAAMVAGLLVLGLCAAGVTLLFLDHHGHKKRKHFSSGGSAGTSFLENLGIAKPAERGFVARRSYAAEISGVLSDMSVNDVGTDSAIQQCANGAYRLCNMLEIIAHQLDRDGSSSTEISAVMTSLKVSDISADSAVQQTANGTYRCVDLLAIIAIEVDRDGDHATEIAAIKLAKSLGDDSANSAFQQVENGAMRIAELLALVCRIADKKGEHESRISSILSNMEVSGIGNKTAMQQTATGLYASCRLMAVLGRIVDRNGGNSSEISSRLSSMETSDTLSDTVFQQMANGYYSLTRLAGLVAEGLNP